MVTRISIQDRMSAASSNARNPTLIKVGETFAERFVRRAKEANAAYEIEQMKLREQYALRTRITLEEEGDPLAPFDAGAEGIRPTCLPCSRFEAVIFSCLLEQAGDELHMLGGHDSKPRPPLPKMEESLVSGRTIHRHIYDRNTMERKIDAHARYQRCQIQKDRRYLEQAIYTSVEQLLRDGMHDALIEVIWLSGIRAREVTFIKTKMYDLKTSVQKMYHKLGQEAEFAQSEDQRIHLEDNKLRREIHDALVIDGVKRRVVARHEFSRREQLNMVLQQTEHSYINSVKENQRLDDIDSRVNNEVVRHLLRQTNHFKDEITAWSDRYDTEIEEFDTELLMKKEAMEELEKDLAALKEIYYTRDQEIEEYLEIKGAKELIIKKNLTTRLLQSWWRGVIFRKKLIPKAKVEKKKKGKKGKKGKK